MKSAFLSLLTVCLLLGFASLRGQAPCFSDACALDPGGDPIPVISYAQEGGSNLVAFGVCCLPELNPVQFPDGRYTFLWDFGDGTFSTEEDPYHIYGETGVFSARVEITAIYTDDKGDDVLKVVSVGSGGAPSDISVLATPFPAESYEVEMDDPYLEITSLRDLVPGSMATYLLTYTNPCGGQPSELNLSLSYPTATVSRNRYPGSPTGPAETIWAFHGEMLASESAGGDESNMTWTWSPESFSPNEQRHMLLNFFINPNAKVGSEIMLSVNLGNPSVGCPTVNYTKGEPVSGSHDPNLKRVNKAFIGGTQPVKLSYEVSFQNEGNLPEFEIRVEDEIDEKLEFCTLVIDSVRFRDEEACYIGIYPTFLGLDQWFASRHITYDTVMDPVNRKVSWIFKGYALPGLAQEVEGEMKYQEKENTSQTWGKIYYSIFTECGFPNNGRIDNQAMVKFSNDSLPTDIATTRKVCCDDLQTSYGNPLPINLLVYGRGLSQFPIDTSRVYLLSSLAGLSYPRRLINPGQFNYLPNSKLTRLDSLARNPGVDILNFLLCDTQGKCFRRSINICIEGAGNQQGLSCNTGTCDEEPCAEVPQPFWIKWLLIIVGVLVLLVLLIVRLFRKS